MLATNLQYLEVDKVLPEVVCRSEFSMLFKTKSNSQYHSVLWLETLENRQMLSSVQILAAGFTGEEIMELQIDGVAVADWAVEGDPNASELHSYLFETTGPVEGEQVRIAFTNDLYDEANNIDRNLRVDAVVIDGVRFETEDPSVFSNGTWLPADGIAPGFRQSEVLHSDGYFEFANDPAPVVGSLIEVVARGKEGEETLSLQIDEETVFTVTNVEDAFQSYYYQADQFVAADQIRVVYSNDFNNDSTIDRDLIVDKILIDGVEFETEAPNVFSNGSWIGGETGGVTPGFWQTEILDVDGYFAYGQDPLTTSQILIRARGFTGNENMSLLIDGVAVASWSEISDTFEDFTFESPTPISADDVRVAFTNDVYDEVNGIDYNLIVDYLSIDGTIYQTESPTVFSTGTWLPADGIVPGFRQQEMLHTNGYFQFSSDSDPGSFALSGSYFIGAESDGSVLVTVNRLGGTDGQVSIDYETFETTATAGLDFVSVSGTLVFQDGVESQTVEIQLLEDDLEEDAETFSFVIDNPVGGAGLLSPRTATVEITNDPGTGSEGPGDPEISVTEEVLVDLEGAVAIEWSADGSKMFIAEFSGRVFVYENGILEATPFIDIRDQVNAVRGLLDIAIHPDFENNPYVYLAFVYDPPEVFENAGLAGPDGAGNRASRVIRVTADATNDLKTAVVGSEVVLLGTNSTWDYYNGAVDSTVDFDEPPGGILPDGTNVQDFMAADSQSHTINSLEFGPDGALYVANGDGASYNAPDPRGARVQDINNLSGKILKIDPLTGEGFTDNPFYDGDLNSNRSKVYQYGLRNPFRMTITDSGDVYVGDVGWTQWEEINLGGPGANFGWPFYSGTVDGVNQQTSGYRDLPEAIAFYATNPTIASALVSLNHVDNEIDAMILGDFYDGTDLPSEYQGNLIFSHLATGYVRAVEFNPDGTVAEIKTLFQGSPFMTQISMSPDGEFYFVDFGTGRVGRWSLDEVL
jgi:glucose/arabinose dehydrogenase